MIRLLADHNLRLSIVTGVYRRDSTIDFVTARSAAVDRLTDPELLAWAAQENRIIVTHDVTTMTGYAYERIRRGEKMPGLFAIAATAPIGDAIESLVLVALASGPEEWVQAVIYLPLV